MTDTPHLAPPGRWADLLNEASNTLTRFVARGSGAPTDLENTARDLIVRIDKELFPDGRF